VSYQVELSARAARDLDVLGRDVQERMTQRLEQLKQNPLDKRLSGQLKNQGGLRKSRVGGWRIIFVVDEAKKTVQVVTIERRGQVYKRI
jgi:mRNA interferase RelE/StbE